MTLIREISHIVSIDDALFLQLIDQMTK